MTYYTYKGINVETITDVTGATVNTDVTNYFPNFKTKLTNYNGEKPLDLPFFINGTTISNKCKAYNQVINTSQTISIPNGVNKMRAIIVGAGGGDGGDGGSGTLNITAYGNNTKSGGKGGIGGVGGIYYFDSNIDITNAGNITINCGTKGNNGSNGNNNSHNETSKNGAWDSGNGGGNGNAGNSTTLSLLNVNYVANGGNGGQGGQGGRVNYNIPSGFGSSDGGDGSGGNSGSGYTSNTLNYSINIGSSNNGYVQIIWLYN